MIDGLVKKEFLINAGQKIEHIYSAVALEAGKLKLPGIITEQIVMNGKEKILINDSSN